MVTLSRFPCPKDRSWDFFVSVGQIHGRTMCFPLRHRWFYYILLVSQTIIFFPKCVVRWDWVYWKARRTGTWTWCCLEIEAKIKKKNTPSKRNSSLLKRDRAPKPKSNFFKHFLFSGAVQIFRAIFFCSILVFKGARFFMETVVAMYIGFQGWWIGMWVPKISCKRPLVVWGVGWTCFYMFWWQENWGVLFTPYWEISMLCLFAFHVFPIHLPTWIFTPWTVTFCSQRERTVFQLHL